MADAKERVRNSNPFATRGTPSLLELTDSMIETEPAVIEREVLVPMPIVQDEQGISWLGNFGISSVGMYINAEVEAISEVEWRDFFSAVKGIKTAYQFIIGDWAAWGIDTLHKTYDEIAEITGYAPMTIEIWASVCRNVNKFMRINSLDFAHHQVVTSLSYEAQEFWLKFAAEHSIPYRELQRRIESNDTTPPAKTRVVLTPVVRFLHAIDPFEQRVLKVAAKAAPHQRQDMAARLRQLADRIERGE